MCPKGKNTRSTESVHTMCPKVKMRTRTESEDWPEDWPRDALLVKKESGYRPMPLWKAHGAVSGLPAGKKASSPKFTTGTFFSFSYEKISFRTFSEERICSVA